MARYRYNPKRNKVCVFCNNWIGNADMQYIDSAVGYEFDSAAKGQCTKKSGATTSASQTCSNNYEPSMEARRLL